MNKKFSTLMAAALLAGSFSVVAQTTTEWVPVTPAQLVNGAEYVIHNGDHSYSVIEGTAGNKSVMPYTDGQNCPLFGIPKADSDSIWTLTKVAGGFTLQSDAENLFPIYLANKGLYTNISNSDLAVFTLGNDSTLSVTVDGTVNYVVAPSKKTGTTGFMVNEKKENALKFAFFMKQDIPSDVTEDVIVANTPTLATTMYVIVDGKYVGLPSTSTKAVGEGLEPYNDPNESCLWIYENGTLQNLQDRSIYLTVGANGNVVASDKAVKVSYDGTVLSVDGVNANVSLANTDEPLPLQGEVDYAEKGSTSIVLFHDGKALSAEGGFVSYVPNNSASTVWSLQAVETTKGVYEVRLVNAGKYLIVKDTNKKDQFVTVKGVTYNPKTDKYTYTQNGQVQLMVGSDYVYVKNNKTLAATSQINQANTFGLGNIQVAYITGQELLRRYGDHFTLKITYKDDYNNEVDVTGVFEGKLVPCTVDYRSGTATYEKDYDDEFMLADENGNIIGVDTKNPLHTGNADYGYALTTITPKDYSLEPSRYEVLFRMEYTPGTADEYVDAITKIYLGSLQVGLQEDSKEDVLVAAAPQYLGTQKLSIALNLGSVVDAKSWLNKPVYYTVESINKKKDNKGNYYGNWGGKVLGLNEYGDIAFISPENVDLNEPEGQFAITYTGSEYTFANRENKNAYSSITLDASKLYKIDETTFAYVNGWTTPDTLSIEPVSNYSSEDGFHRISPADLNAKTYTVAMKLLNGDFLNIIENHNDKHRVGLDEENATEWRIEMPTVKLLDATKDFLRYAADTVKVVTPINYYVDGDFRNTQITNPKGKYYYPNTELQICTYILKNTDTDEYLYGKDHNESTGNAYYVCNEDEKTATRIALKEDGEDTYNLVPVYEYVPSGYGWDDPEDYKLGEEKFESEFKTRTERLSLDRNNKKIIGGTTSLTGVLKDADLYEATSNDLFVINDATAPTYKKLEQGDKIILSLKNNTENVLFEDTPFASIGNRVAHTDINPTLYVDTAYVNRVGNYAYQYLLGVNINRIDTTENCGNPNHEHPRTVITEGRFLMSMVDSAKIEDENNVHINKFKYGNEHKLAFVPGYHQNDTLYLTNKAGEVVSKMEVGNDSYNMAKFAFKMIDEKDNEFIVELGDGYDKKEVAKGEFWAQVSNVVIEPSYLRWVNGNLVVTSDINEAAHFTMEASDKEATANENIAAGNVVVAGVDGAVVVKGAEGKNVIVSTILGKVVANEVVSSDNATIAAPAGIVVVSVDGESFKVVVK